MGGRKFNERSALREVVKKEGGGGDPRFLSCFEEKLESEAALDSRFLLLHLSYLSTRSLLFLLPVVVTTFIWKFFYDFLIWPRAEPTPEMEEHFPSVSFRAAINSLASRRRRRRQAFLADKFFHRQVLSSGRLFRRQVFSIDRLLRR